jgi:hypothetical protein
MDHALSLLNDWPISPQDAVVLASVDLFMREKSAGPKLFANKNTRDFMEPDVVSHFERCDCRILCTFTAARQLTEASLSS